MKTVALLLALIVSPMAVHAVSQAQSVGDIKVSDVVFAPTNVTGITSISSPIIPTASYVTLMSTGLNLILRGKPTISTTTAFGGAQNIQNGMWLTLGSTATIAYQLIDNSVLSGTMLNLTGPGSMVSSTSTITLIYNGSTGMWNQVR